jgi:hypothetical protein
MTQHDCSIDGIHEIRNYLGFSSCGRKVWKPVNDGSVWRQLYDRGENARIPAERETKDETFKTSYPILEHSRVTRNGAGHYRAIEKLLEACRRVCVRAGRIHGLCLWNSNILTEKHCVRSTITTGWNMTTNEMVLTTHVTLTSYGSHWFRERCSGDQYSSFVEAMPLVRYVIYLQFRLVLFRFNLLG